jgi:hypothetical protein
MRSLAPALLLVIAACAACASSRIASDTFDASSASSASGPPDAPPRDDVMAGPAALFVGATDRGLALVDVASGRLVARAAGGIVEDLVVDAPRRRVLAYEVDDLAQEAGGALVARDLELPTGLGAPRRLAFVDGRLRLGTARDGAVVFEDAYGPRWRFLSAAVASVGLSSPMPSAAWTTRGGAGVQALTHEAEGGWAIRTVDVRAAGLSPIDVAPLPALHHESARAVALDDGRVVALDVDAQALVVRPAGCPPTRLAPTVQALAEARALPGGVVAVLATGPSRLVVFVLDDGGSVHGFGTLPLDEPLRSDAGLLSRGLLALGTSRLIVATSRRALAVDLAISGQSVLLVRDRAFDGQGVHAPIDGPVATTGR